MLFTLYDSPTSEQGIGFSWGGESVGRSGHPCPISTSPWEQRGFPLAATATQGSQLCSAGLLSVPGLSSLDFLPRCQSCPASLCRVTAVPRALGREQSSLPGKRCHCQRAAVSQQCIFGSLWTLQLKMCQKNLGKVQETWSTWVLAYWPSGLTVLIKLS